MPSVSGTGMPTSSFPGSSWGGTTYRLYKKATAAVAEWLIETVQAAEFVVPPAAAATTSCRIGDGQKGQEYALRIDQFVPYTLLIVTAKADDPRVDIPARIIYLVEMTIKARLERHRFMKGQDGDCDQRHEYIIGVFREVHRLLKQCYQKKSSSRSGTKEKSRKPLKDTGERKETEWYTNLFKVLEDRGGCGTEEGEEEGEDETIEEDVLTPPVAAISPSSPRSKRKNNKSKKARDRMKNRAAQAQDPLQVLETADKDWASVDDIEAGNLEDPYFVLYCLLHDVESMRSYLKELWTEYKQGGGGEGNGGDKVDLVTVSLTANAAFDIVRTYELDCPAIKPLLKNWPETITGLLRSNPFAAAKAADGEDNGALTSEPKHHDPFVRRLAADRELSELTFANAVYLLNAHRKRLNEELDYYLHRTPNPNRAHDIADLKANDDDMHTLFPRKKGDHDDGDNDARSDSSSKKDNDIVEEEQQRRCINRWKKERFGTQKFAREVSQSPSLARMTEDHFTHMWNPAEMMGEEAVTFEQALGMQMHYDIREVMHNRIGNGYRDLVEACERIKASFGLFKAWRRNHSQPDVTRWNTNGAIHNMETMAKDLDEIINHREEYFTNKMNFFEGVGCALEGNPVLCGVWLFQIEMMARVSGAFISSGWRSILAAGQLYQACQLFCGQKQQQQQQQQQSGARVEGGKRENEGEDDEESDMGQDDKEVETPLHWPEMEQLFQWYGREYFFNYTLPRSIRDLRLHHGLFEEGRPHIRKERKRLVQIETAKYDPTPAPPTVTTSVREEGGAHRPTVEQQEQLDQGDDFGHFGHLRLSHRLYISKYRARCVGQAGPVKATWTQENLLALLHDRINDSSRSLSSETESLLSDRFDSSMDISGGSHTRGRRPASSTEEKLSTQVLILRELKVALQNEHKARSFDYMKLHVRCMELLGKLQRQVTDKVKEEHSQEEGESFEVNSGELVSAFVGKIFIYMDKLERGATSSPKLKGKKGSKGQKKKKIARGKSASKAGQSQTQEGGDANGSSSSSILVHCDATVRQFLAGESETSM